MKNYGLDALSILDNGSGMEKKDLEKVTQRGTTTKIKKDDFLLNEIEFLGFRGEALYGLANIAKEVKISSK